jgi:RHS repeat-associated protein
MTSQTINGTTTSFNYNSANEITNAGFSFDGNGNLLNSPVLGLAYNAKGQMTTMNGMTITHAAGAMTERLSQGATTYLNDRLGVSREVATSGTIDYTRDISGKIISERLQSTGQNYYYLFDGQGSVVALTDSAGNAVANFAYRYEPFGKLANSLPTNYPTNQWGFEGGYRDQQTGLYKYSLGYYDATTGRWTQPLQGQSKVLPANSPIYAFVQNNPINGLPNQFPGVECVALYEFDVGKYARATGDVGCRREDRIVMYVRVERFSRAGDRWVTSAYRRKTGQGALTLTAGVKCRFGSVYRGNVYWYSQFAGEVTQADDVLLGPIGCT